MNTQAISAAPRKSLRRRLIWGFALTTATIWSGLLIWGYLSATQTGERWVEEELKLWAEQILSVAVEFSHDPQRLGRAFAKVAELQSLPSPLDDEPEQIVLQLWIDGTIAQDVEIFSSDVPIKQGFSSEEVSDETWWRYSLSSPNGKVWTTVSGMPGTNASIRSGDVFFFFVPLVVSLPLLLVPAWLMTRYGLKPLHQVVHQLEDRVSSGELKPLQPTAYKELNPVVTATNNLMARLDVQMRRERALVADVAHELKTPLAIMQANLGILESSSDQQRRSEATDDLITGIQRSDRLIQQLLRMAKLEQSGDQSLLLRNIDIAEFVRERIAQIEPLANKKQLLLDLMAPSQCVAQVDIDAFAAILDNLVDNAIKYSPKQGRIQITLEENAGKDGLLLSFEDEGPGIAQQDLSQAFTRFRRFGKWNLSDAYPSAGLGLAIVHQAVQRLGGEVTLGVSPELGGLLVQVSFPTLAS